MKIGDPAARALVPIVLGTDDTLPVVAVFLCILNEFV
jgi:hypothetical protein